MLIPKTIKSHKYKIRDTKICLMFVREELSLDDIGKRFGLSHQRVSQILQRNSHLLIPDKEWETAKQIRRIKQIIRKKGVKGSKKDVLEWENLLDKKITVAQELRGAARETNIIVIRSSDDQQRISLRREGVTVDRTSTTEAQGADKAQVISG